MRAPAAVAGLLGGLCWLAAYLVDTATGSGAVVDGLTWAGIALVTIAALGAVAGLVTAAVSALALVRGRPAEPAAPGRRAPGSHAR